MINESFEFKFNLLIYFKFVLHLINTDIGHWCHYRANGPVEFESFKNTIILDMEKTEDKLNNSWFPGIINVFADKNTFVSPKAEKLDSFFDCVTTLISNQVRLLTNYFEYLWITYPDVFVSIWEHYNLCTT